MMELPHIEMQPNRLSNGISYIRAVSLSAITPGVVHPLDIPSPPTPVTLDDSMSAYFLYSFLIAENRL